ncbi:hypothetical protein cyc_04315 [Cyclospora cayetanensis]|uniref:Uncharacterized protein n=1 Tax=Cyclospora cayetanensis TaxID=88456 RepID=A0A1D3D774_9EIME|nr:hypothetical protein cyc_04315 [Cyclospora cayetanensis]
MLSPEQIGLSEDTDNDSAAAQLQHASSLWDRLRDQVDNNRRWISSCLYFALCLLIVLVKRSISDHRVNRIRTQSDIPSRVLARRKTLVGIVFSVDPQGYIYVNHVPLLHALLPLLPQTPFLASTRARDCICLRLDKVELLPDVPSTEGSSAFLLSCRARDTNTATEGSSTDTNNSSTSTSAAVLKRVLLGKRVYFVPVEVEVGYVWADIMFRSAFVKRDLARYMVSRGVAVTNHSSFHPCRPLPASSFIHNLRDRVTYHRVGLCRDVYRH